MTYRPELVFELDDASLAFMPRPPASTGALAYELVDTDGVLTWEPRGTADFDLIVTDGGAVVVDDVTGNVVIEG
jgi:hypothetical protein